MPRFLTRRPQFLPLEKRVLLSASPAPTDGLLGPLQIQSIEATERGLEASGGVSLPGGTFIPFSTDVAADVRQQSDTTTIIDLTLGPVDLDLLGVRVDLAEVGLEVTATRGEGLVLGNVLTDLLGDVGDGGGGSAAGMASGIGQAVGAALGGQSDVLSGLPIGEQLASLEQASGLSGLLGGLDLSNPASAAAAVPQSQTSGNMGLVDEVQVLRLSVAELDLALLGLGVKTTAPLELSVTASSGPGKLLGNLLVYLSSLADGLLPPDVGGGGSGGSGNGSDRISTNSAPSSTDMAGDDLSTLIGLELRDVNLDLLGLQVNLNVDLLLGTRPEGLVGSLLLDQLAQLEQQVLDSGFVDLDALTGFLLSGEVPDGFPNTSINPGGGSGVVGSLAPAGQSTTQSSAAGLSEALGGGLEQALQGLTSGGGLGGVSPGGGMSGGGMSGGMMESGDNPLDARTLLNLSIDELDLELLGLVLQSQGVQLDLGIDPGRGKLLGNLVGGLLGIVGGGATGGGGLPGGGATGGGTGGGATGGGGSSTGGDALEGASGNNGRESAARLPGTGTYNATLTDNDWYALEVGPGTFTADLAYDAAGGGIGFELYDANGNLLTGDYQGDGSATLTAELDRAQTVFVFAYGIPQRDLGTSYRLNLSSGSGSNNSGGDSGGSNAPAGGNSSGGSDVVAFQPDRFEQGVGNDDASTAARIGRGTLRATATDNDWYELDLRAGRFEAILEQDRMTQDLNIELYDQNLNRIAGSYNDFRQSGFSVDLQNAGTYRLFVYAADNNPHGGIYTLRV